MLAPTGTILSLFLIIIIYAIFPADTMLTHALQLGAKVFVDEYGWFWFENATIIPIDYSSPDYPFPEYPQYYLNLNKFPKNFDDYNKGFGDNIPRTTNTAGHWEVGEICDRKQLSELVAGQESHPIEIEDNTQVSGHATVLKKVKLVIHPPPTTRKRGRKPKVSPKRPRQPKVIFISSCLFVTLITLTREKRKQHLWIRISRSY